MKCHYEEFQVLQILNNLSVKLILYENDVKLKIQERTGIARLAIYLKGEILIIDT